MTLSRRLLLHAYVVALVLVPAARLHAQSNAQPQQVQFSPSPLNGCTPSHTDAAINTAVTVTLTPPNGQFVYLCGWEYQVTNDATGTGPAMTLTKFTSTNLGGVAALYSLAATANIQQANSFMYQIPLKSAQSGVAVTLVSPAINAHAMYSITAYYYFAP